VAAMMPKLSPRQDAKASPRWRLKNIDVLRNEIKQAKITAVLEKLGACFSARRR
jgi:hypothetical protein